MFKFSGIADDLYSSEFADTAAMMRKGKATKADLANILTQNADKSIVKNEKWWAIDKARAGKKLTTKERLGETAIGATALGMVGGVTGAIASMPAQLLKIPFKKLRGAPMAAVGTVAGGAIGAVTGGVSGWKHSKRSHQDPGPKKDYGNIMALKRFKKEIKNPESEQYQAWITEEGY